MGRSIFTHLVIIQALGLCVVAWAGTGKERLDREPAGLAKLDSREQAKLDIRGLLSCPMPEENNGRSCTLQIVDEANGKTLRIVGSKTAMRLFQDGQTKVVATGVISGDALQVIAIRAE